MWYVCRIISYGNLLRKYYDELKIESKLKRKVIMYK